MCQVRSNYFTCTSPVEPYNHPRRLTPSPSLLYNEEMEAQSRWNIFPRSHGEKVSAWPILFSWHYTLSENVFVEEQTYPKASIALALFWEIRWLIPRVKMGIISTILFVLSWYLFQPLSQWSMPSECPGHSRPWLAGQGCVQCYIHVTQNHVSSGRTWGQCCPARS